MYIHYIPCKNLQKHLEDHQNPLLSLSQFNSTPFLIFSYTFVFEIEIEEHVATVKKEKCDSHIMKSLLLLLLLLPLPVVI